jgi:Eukaryotic aspartyl protease
MILFALYALGILVAVVDCLAAAPLSKTRTVIPPPISITPAENWEGIDGDWNTFAIRVGNPAEVVRVLVSTTSQVVWVVDPRACVYATDKNACSDSRGGLFYSNKSTTWQEEGLFDLYIDRNLNLTGNGMFGYDSVALGYLGQGGPNLQHQIVGSIAVEDFWFGHFGLHPKTTNFTDLSENVPSFMSTLKAQNLIPSVSWGYTQGAPYRKASLF